MIEVTRFDGTVYYINPHLIESLESNPDTTVTLMPTKKIVVRDSIATIIERIISYRKRIGIGVSDSEVNEHV